MSERKERRDKSEAKNTDESAKRVQRRGRKVPRVPPPDSAVWPEQYRGDNWKPVYAILFEGCCQVCAYSCPLPKSRQLRDKLYGETRLLHCTNHPDNPGELTEVLPIGTCRNFKPKPWHRPRPQPPKRSAKLEFDDTDPTIRRIPLGNGRFAVIDACDYEEISQYKWRASHHGSTIYARAIASTRFGLWIR